MIQYPSGHGPKPSSPNNLNQRIRYGNRGMSLEEMLNQSNTYYLQRNLAVIHKKPTPIQVVKVDYPRRSAARITEAYYRRASTTDYNGVYQGKYIDFEAKETNHLRFPLANLPEHQVQHMQQCVKQGGIIFLLVFFKQVNEVYLLPFFTAYDFIKNTQRKSIPYDFFHENGYLCPISYNPPIDYLKAVDDWLASGTSSEN